MLDIVAAMSSPKLFQPWFEGDSWNGWKAVLKAAYCLPMTSDEIDFFRSVAERDPPRRRVREMWLIVGRGGGKDSIASLIITTIAMLFDRKTSKLRPGERALVACLAVDREQSTIVKNYVRSFFHDLPTLRQMIERETADGLQLANSVDISVVTNSHRSIRGRSMLAVVFDEVAFFRDETSTSPDEEVYRACRPALARVPGSIAIGISSPYKKSGLLYRKFSTSYGKNDDDVLVIRAASKMLNPTLDDAEIERDLQDDYAAARAEWFAEWRDDVAGWLPLEVIEAARDFGVTVRPPLLNSSKRVIYRSGVDPSGGQKDSFTAAVAHDEDGVAILDCLVEIKAPFDPSNATRQIAEVLKSYGLHSTVGDRYAANWVVSAFAEQGLRYTHSERDRSQIYPDAMPLFTTGKVRLLDNQRLIAQYAQLERRTNPLGRDRVDHGAGGHDDCANAASLALITKKKTGFRPTPEMLRRASESTAYSRRRTFSYTSKEQHMITMPSPNHTNLALRFLPDTFNNPVAAYDSARGITQQSREHDGTAPDNEKNVVPEDIVNRIMMLLEARLTPSELLAVKNILTSPPKRKGSMNTIGEDSRRVGFDSRYPGVADRIRNEPALQGMPPTPLSRRSDPESFYSRFPEARRIGQ